MNKIQKNPKYKKPMSDITDLAGVRVITFFPSTVVRLCQLIQEEFEVIERGPTRRAPNVNSVLAI